MAMDNATGDVLALVGGRDFNLSQFDRATQAERQTGSSFKPYVYTAAVEDGATPAETIVDRPVSFGNYVPHNYDGKFKGRISLLEAFADSRNIPALEARRPRRHPQGHRHRASLRRHHQHSALLAHRSRLG